MENFKLQITHYRFNVSSRRGQSLLVALILLVIGAILVMTNVVAISSTSKYNVWHGKIVQERYLAEAGLQMTLHKLNSDETFSNEIQNLRSGQRNPFDDTDSPATIQWEDGAITVVIEPY